MTDTQNREALEVLDKLRSGKSINGDELSTIYAALSPVTNASEDVSIPDGMMLVRKSSMLEPDFEKMGRQILDQAKHIKGLVKALEEIYEHTRDNVYAPEVARKALHAFKDGKEGTK